MLKSKALDAGALGFIMKDADSKRLLHAIRQVSAKVDLRVGRYGTPFSKLNLATVLVTVQVGA